METVHIYLDEKNDAVQVTVPDHQLEEWDELAEKNDMSRSMFVRSCVEAGRKQLALLDPTEQEDSKDTVESKIIESLQQEDVLDAEELVERVFEPVQTEVYDTIEELDDSNRITYSARDGGYTLQ